MARPPSTGRVTSPFGRRPKNPLAPAASTMHLGQDRIGYGNVAPEDGVVVSARASGGWGNLITFNGDSGTTHLLAHNERFLCAPGKRYAEGFRLGIMGRTGVADGVHVHWETRLNGVPYDPDDWLRAHTNRPAGIAPEPIITQRKKEDMKLIWDNGTGYLVTDQGMTGLPSPMVYNLFYRLINSDQAASPFFDGAGLRTWVKSGYNAHPAVFNRAEVDIMSAHLRLIATSVQTGVAIDTDKLKLAIRDALGGVKLEDASAAALSAALDLAVPRIAAATRRAIVAP